MQDSTSDKVNSSSKTGNTRAGFPTKHTSEKRKLKHYQGLTPTCILHGDGHSTEDCKTIQKWAKKQKTDYAQKKDYSDDKLNKWTKRSGLDKNFSKNNLNAMVAKAVRASVQEAFSMSTETQNNKTDSSGDNNSINNSNLDLDNIKLNTNLFSNAESNNDSSHESSQENEN